ncbi:uncharacterized protein LY89DRAFT_684212 [Mollisia scopiformis]|uniref:Uncharacterized protein n=1 Tax=Mollisia scopiformis TaxID=149040 RepID=A0A194XDR3_MOLSC|nr:uncharacterized protein LY89DRAFT_684212 [Mollisia scopiformis]KUJ18291.1 hypothetical protein LY89DRAFT_684212 [Mollisia scopiformis]
MDAIIGIIGAALGLSSYHDALALIDVVRHRAECIALDWALAGAAKKVGVRNSKRQAIISYSQSQRACPEGFPPISSETTRRTINVPWS